jgi:hypothetical protein
VSLPGRIPRDVPGDSYRLAFSPQKEMPAAAWLPAGVVAVLTRDHQFDRPAIDHPVPASASFGEVAQLLGYNLDLSQVETDGHVRLTLFWQALQETETSYKVFVHLLDPAGTIVSQIDRAPQGGAALTTSWLAGEIITDEIKVPAGAGLANVEAIAVGLYDPLTGRRLPVGSDDKLLLKLR